jgi:predicted MFS family arabinose efflux permease
MWAPLQEKGYRRLFAGHTLSDLANWLDFIAISAIMVYGWGYGPAEMALLSLCSGIPWVVIGPFASGLMGRFSGKKVLIACDALRAGIVLAMVWADSLALMLALVFCKMSVSSVFDPVRQQAVKRLVDAERLAQASSLSGLSVHATKIVGPMLGGVLAAGLGQSAPFAIGAGLYALSAAVLAGLPHWEGDAGSRAGESGVMRRTLSYIAARPELRTAILYMGLLFALIFMYDNLFIILAKEAGLGENHYGLLIGGVGAGSVAGSLAAGYWDGWKRRPIARMSLAGLSSGLLLALVGLSGTGWLPVSVWSWLLAAAALGYSGAQVAVPFSYLLQAETSDETIAPVASLASAVQTSSMLLAPSIGAAAAAHIGAGGVFIAAGLAMTATGLIVWSRSRSGGATERERKVKASVSSDKRSSAI